MTSKEARIEASKEYLAKSVDKLMNKLVVDLLRKKPEDVLVFISEWANNEIKKRDANPEAYSFTPSQSHYTQKPEEKQEVPIIDAPVINPQKQSSLLVPGQKDKSETEESEESEEDEDFLAKKKAKAQAKGIRPSVSAESYGLHNKKGNYVARVIPKSDEVKERIRAR